MLMILEMIAIARNASDADREESNALIFVMQGQK
jgi:hypothetical protein